MDISVSNSTVSVKKEASDAFSSTFHRGHNISEYHYYEFTSDKFIFAIGNEKYNCLFADLTIGGVAPADFDAAEIALSVELNAGSYSPTGATGTFTTNDTQTVTVENGIITDIVETLP